MRKWQTSHGNMTWSDWTVLCSAQYYLYVVVDRIIMFASNQEHEPCWVLHIHNNFLTPHNHPWSMCYSFPHSRQFHFVGVDAGTISWSQLWRVLTLGLGNRDLFGWLRRLLHPLLGEFLIRLFPCLDLQGLARTGSLSHLLYSCWEPVHPCHLSCTFSLESTLQLPASHHLSPWPHWVPPPQAGAEGSLDPVHRSPTKAWVMPLFQLPQC